MVQKWQLGSPYQKIKAVSDCANHEFWDEPLEMERPQMLGHKGNHKTMGKALKLKAGPVLQNRWYIGGVLGSKQDCQKTQRCHTTNDACPTNER